MGDKSKPVMTARQQLLTTINVQGGRGAPPHVMRERRVLQRRPQLPVRRHHPAGRHLLARLSVSDTSKPEKQTLLRPQHKGCKHHLCGGMDRPVLCIAAQASVLRVEQHPCRGVDYWGRSESYSDGPAAHLAAHGVPHQVRQGRVRRQQLQQREDGAGPVCHHLQTQRKGR